jgi:hypothetical protein
MNLRNLKTLAVAEIEAREHGSHVWDYERDLGPKAVLALLDVAEKAREAMKGANRDAWDAFRTSLAALGEQGK